MQLELDTVLRRAEKMGEMTPWLQGRSAPREAAAARAA